MEIHKRFVILIVNTIIITEVTALYVTVYPGGWWYMRMVYYEEELSWFEALETCENRNMTLLIADYLRYLAYIQSVLGQTITGDLWTSGYKHAHSNMWFSDPADCGKEWYPSIDDEDHEEEQCMVIPISSEATLKRRAEDCTKTHPYLCMETQDSYYDMSWYVIHENRKLSYLPHGASTENSTQPNRFKCIAELLKDFGSILVVYYQGDCIKYSLYTRRLPLEVYLAYGSGYSAVVKKELNVSIDRTVRNQNLTKYTTYPCPHPNPVTTMTSYSPIASSTVTQTGELGNTFTTTVTETVDAGDEVISTDIQNGGHDDTSSVNPTGNPYELPVSTVEPSVDTDFVTNDVYGHLETTSSSNGETTVIEYQTSTPVSESTSITTEGSNLNVVGTAKQSVNTREITAQSVPTGNITAHSVTSDEITTQSVTSDEITTQSVNSDEIATQSVTSGEITTKSVTSGEITTQSVTSGEITTQSVQVISVETTTQSLNTGGIRTHSVSTNEITTQRVHTLEVTTQSVDFVDTISQSVNTGEVSKQSVSTDETTSQIVNIGDVTTQRVNIDETVTLSAHTSETVSTTDYERATSYISDTVSFDTATNVFSDSPSPEVEISTNQNNEVGLSTLPPFNNTQKPYCHCSCKDIGNLTESLLQKKIQDMKDNLSLTKGNLSSVRRTKVSAHDARISSQSAGYVATAILVTISALFIIIDLSNIVQFCIR